MLPWPQGARMPGGKTPTRGESSADLVQSMAVVRGSGAGHFEKAARTGAAVTQLVSGVPSSRRSFCRRRRVMIVVTATAPLSRRSHGGHLEAVSLV